MTLTEAIIVKISHDLAGGIGAFSNTVDLMKMDPSFQQEGLALLENTGTMLNMRLKFFRALYGFENKTITSSLVRDYLSTLACSIQIQGKVTSRLNLAMVALGIELLGIEGKIKLDANTMVLTGPEIVCKPDVIRVLMGEKVPYGPENVTAAWLMNLAQESGKHLTIDEKESDLVLTIA